MSGQLSDPGFRLRILLLLLGLALASSCSTDTPVSSPPSSARAATGDPSSVVIPDSGGSPVVPTPTGSDNPEKSWEVPDAGGTTDRVSAIDALFLAAARPAVPYTSAAGTVTNSTLIALGRKACTPADRYEAGGQILEGAAAQSLHEAALPAYC